MGSLLLRQFFGVSSILLFVIVFFTSPSADAYICVEPLSVDEPADDGTDTTNDKNNKGKGGQGGNSSEDELTTQNCDNNDPPPTPSTPTNVTASVTNTTSGSYTVSWSASSNMEVGKYEVRELRNGSTFKIHETNRFTTNISLTSNPDGNYEYRVQACNEDINTGGFVCSSESSPSSTVYVRHKPTTPSAPSNINSTSSNYTISWDKPSGAVSHYWVQERVYGGTWSTIASSHSSTSINISGKANNSRWEYRVRACNTYNWACSTYSSNNTVHVRLKPSVPSTPANVDSTSSGYSISWNKPSGTVSHYSVQERAYGGTWSTIASSHSSTSINISGKANNSRWEYRVRACNTYSWACSSYSANNTVHVRFKPSTPAAPTISSSNSNGAVTVSWTKPSGTVSYYNLQKRNNSGSWSTVATGLTTTSHSVSSLTDGSWDFRVQACNGYSWACSALGADSGDVTVRLRPATPAKPSVSTTQSSDSVTVSWAQPSGTVSYYRIQKRKNQGSWEWTFATSNTTATSHTVTGLTDGVWQFRVTACNDFDWACSIYSPNSDEVSVLRKPEIPSSITGPASLDDDGSFTLSWGAATGQVDYYETAHRHQPIGGTFGVWTNVNRDTDLSHDYSGLADGEWDFAVRACNASGCSGLRYIDPHVQVLRVPGVPSYIEAEDVKNIVDQYGQATSIDMDGMHTINWGTSQGSLVNYVLESRFKPYGNSSYGEWDEEYNDTAGSKSFTNRGDGDWDYRVKGCNEAGCSAFLNVSPIVTVLKPPKTPTSVSVPSSDDDGAFTLSWSSGGGVVEYFEFSESFDFTPWASAGIATSRTITGKGDGSWSYRVQACNSSGCGNYGSSNTVTVTHPTPAMPASITVPPQTSESRYQINWQTSTSISVDDYQISQQHDSNGWSGWTNVSGTSAQVTVDKSGDWTHRVRACNVLPDSTRKCSSAKVSSVVDVLLPADWARTGGDVVDQSYGYSDTIASDETVGAVEGEAGVSGGAATYNIPIVVPPGRKGMQPNVSLNYSSRSGNGIAGVGWSVSAGSSIHRCSATYAQDGYTKSATMSADDKLCLDGQRLIVVNGTYGQSGAEYRTELDSFARITQLDGALNSGASFTVEHKNNRISYYGNTTDSKHIPEGLSEPLSWAISKQQDRSGNYISYQYYSFGEGEYALQSIQYTGGNTNAPNRSVDFIYETRPDVSTSYIAGGKNRSTRRLAKVQTYYQGQKIRDYKLTYGVLSVSSSRSLLRHVEECAGETCLPLTQFEWHEKAPKYELEKVSAVTQSTVKDDWTTRLLYKHLPHADFNGDGVKDWPEYLTDAEGRIKEENTNPALSNCYKPLNSFSLVCPQADFDNDGKTDQFRNNNGIFQIRLSTTGSWINTEINWEGVNNYYSGGAKGYPLAMADFNGDGYSDVAFFHPLTSGPELRLYYHTRNMNAPYTDANSIKVSAYNTNSTGGWWSGSSSAKSITTSIQPQGDMDGNGLPDFIVSTLNPDYPSMPRPINILLNQGNSFSSQALTGHFDHSALTAKGDAVSGDIFADINGDGLADWLAVGSGGNKNLYLKLNQGGGNFETIWRDLGFKLPMKGGAILNSDGDTTGIYSVPIMNKVLFFDYDGNGKPEILVADNIVISACNSVSAHTGGGWKCDQELYGKYQPSMSNQVQDIGSDNIDDAVYQYDAIFIDEALNGAISSRVESTNILASGTQHAAIDAYGNGMTDIVSVFGCRWADDTDCRWNSDSTSVGGTQTDSSREEGVYVMRNWGAADFSPEENKPIDTLKRITNGTMGMESSWVYKPLGTGDYGINDDENFHDPVHGYQSGDPEYFHFASSMYAVAEFNQANGVGGLNSTRYRYDGAMYNTQGRGFQGFKTVIVDNMVTKIRSVSHFHQKFPLSGKLEASQTCLLDAYVDGCSNSVLSEATFSWDIWRDGVKRVTIASTDTDFSSEILDGSSIRHRYWVAPQSQTSTSYKTESSSAQPLIILGNNAGDVLSTKTVTNTHDQYGNTTTSVVVEDNGFQETQKTQSTTFNYDSVADWWLTKISSSSVNTTTVSQSSVAPIEPGTDTDKSSNTQYSYSADGLIHRVPTTTIATASDTSQSHTTTVGLNAHGLPKSVTQEATGSSGSGLTRTVRTTYSSDGYFPKTVTTENGNFDLVTTTTISAKHGQPTSVTDANGNTVNYTYDAFGRVKSTTVPGGKLIETGYQWCNGYCANAPTTAEYMEFTKQAGSPTVKTYKDMFNRTVMVETMGFDGSSIYTSVDYDELGRKVFESTPSLNVPGSKGTHYDLFDELGRLLLKTTNTANGSSYTTEYDYDGHTTLITVTDGRTLSMSRTYGGDGKLIQTTDAMGGVTRYAYDSMGNPITLEDAKGSPIHAWHNGFGHKTQVDDPNMGVKTFVYNTFGEVEQEIDANGDKLTMQYDSLGRLKQRLVNNVAQASYTYDRVPNGLGLPATESGTGIDKAFYYDEYSRPKRQVTTIDGTPYETITEYDSNFGRVIAVQYPASSIKVGYTYNQYGYQTKTFNADSGFVYQKVEQRDAFLNITEALKNADSMTEARNYDSVTGQLRSIVAREGDEQKHFLDYWYGSFGNLSWQEVQYENGAKTSRENYTYDDLHRLTYSSRSFTGVIHSEDPITYEYDAVGNLEQKSDYASTLSYGGTGGAGPNAVSSIQKIKPDGSTILVDDFEYDANGNLTKGDGKIIDYNVFNKPISISKGGINSTFAYGADLMRFKQVKTGLPEGDETTIYLDKMVEIVEQGGSTITRTYIDDIAIISKEDIVGQPLADHKIRFTLRDRLGSVVTLTDHHNNIMEHRSYDPFGKPRTGDFMDVAVPTLREAALSDPHSGDVIDNIPFTNRGFTDHEHLDDAELIHMNGRAYDYNLGRFLSVDPFIQEPGNSQSMNPYSYIMNNPLAGTDPTGYKSEGVDMSSCVGKTSCSQTVSVDVSETGSKITKQVDVEVTISKDANGKISFSGTMADKNGFEQKLDFGTMKGKVDEIGSPSSQADSERRSRMLDGMSSVAVEHEERMNGLEDMFEASERKQAEARDAAAERLNEEQVERLQREIDAERQQVSRQPDVVPQFPFENINSAQGDAMIAVAILSSPALIAASPATISAVGTASRVVTSGAATVVRNRKKIMQGCVLITSLCNNVDDLIHNRKAGPTDIRRGGQIEKIYREGDAVRRLNEHLKNVPTKVK